MAIHTNWNERCSTAFLDLNLLIMCTWCRLWTAKLPHYAIPLTFVNGSWSGALCVGINHISSMETRWTGRSLGWFKAHCDWEEQDDGAVKMMYEICAASYTCKCCEGRMLPAGRIFETHTHVFELVITAGFQSSLLKMLLYVKRAGWWRREGDVWNHVLNLPLAGVVKGE